VRESFGVRSTPLCFPRRGAAAHLYRMAAGKELKQPMNIRSAVSEDAAAIARAQVRSWQAAYENILPDAYLANLSVEKRELMWREFIARGSPELLVARDGECIVGFVAFGPCRDEGMGAARAEIWAIYVTPSHWSQGVGSQLWERARLRLTAQGYRGVSLWVLTGNERAIQFYGRVGFAVDEGSAKEVVLDGKALQEIRYVADLD
jgi:ribosomal protein S18 acetylase RimI-like enzyme